MRASAGALAAVLVVVVTLMGAAAGRAQEPAATPPATPAGTTAPSGCTVEARPLSFLETLVRLPDPDVTPVPVESVPEGVPVDEATRAEITATVTMLIACA